MVPKETRREKGIRRNRTAMLLPIKTDTSMYYMYSREQRRASQSTSIPAACVSIHGQSEAPRPIRYSTYAYLGSPKDPDMVSHPTIFLDRMGIVPHFLSLALSLSHTHTHTHYTGCGCKGWEEPTYPAPTDLTFPGSQRPRTLCTKL